MVEKQIEEMAKEICSEYDCVIPCQSCAYYGYANCRDVKSAEKLYAAGYRKASEVARELITEIADFMWQGESEKLNISFNNRFYNKQEFIAELKKKYESEGTE